jgi:hypothetical protein
LELVGQTKEEDVEFLVEFEIKIRDSSSFGGDFGGLGSRSLM